MRLNDLLQEYRQDYLDAKPGPGKDSTVGLDMDGFEARLQAELRKQERRRIVLPIFALAAAAALVFVLLLPRPKLSMPIHPASFSEVVAKPAAPPLRDVESIAQVALARPAASKPVPRRRSLSQPQVLASTPERPWSEFVPLAQSRLLPQPDVLQVLRVSVSSDRLAALGIATPSGYAEPGENNVAAELLLGDDGLVRAVRVLY